MKKVCPDLGKSDYQEKTLDVRMRSTETEPIYNDCKGGRGDWWPQHQPDSLWDTARRFSGGHPSSYQPPPTGLNLSQRKGMVSTKPHFAKPIHQLSLTWTDWNPVTLWAAQVVGFESCFNSEIFGVSFSLITVMIFNLNIFHSAVHRYLSMKS